MKTRLQSSDAAPQPVGRPPSPRRLRRGRRFTGFRGFSLLEVVVSLAILGIGLTAVLQIFSGGFRNIRRIDLAHQAMAHGENVMNQILTDQEIIGPTALSGDLDEEFSYTAEVTDWVEPSDKLTLDQSPLSVSLLSVSVRIHFKGDRFGKYYQLRCLKAVSQQAQDGVPLQDPIQQLFGRSQ